MEMLDSLPAFKVRRLPPSTGADLRLTTHPNPTSNGAETRFTVAEAERVRVVVSELDGSFAMTLLDEWMDVGRYAVAVDTRRFRPGIYLIQVHVGSTSQLAKLVIER